MPRILRSSLVNEDLIAIWDYISQENQVAASQVLQKIDHAMQLLAVNPLLGERQPQFGTEMRRFVLGTYLIFYEPIEDGIQVVRIFHGARRYDELI